MGKTKKKLAYLHVCNECIERPAFMTQNEIQIHKMKFHQSSSSGDSSTTTSKGDMACQGFVQGLSKTTRRMNELFESKKILKEQLKETKAEVKRLDTLAGNQSHTVRLLKAEIQTLERRYVAKNLEISKLKNHAEILCQEGIPKRITKPKTDLFMSAKAEGFRQSIDAENLCLIDSMRRFTGKKPQFESISTESSSEEEIRKSAVYKKSRITNVVRQLKTLQHEVDDLKNLKQDQKQNLAKQVSAHDETVRAYHEAKHKLAEKINEVEGLKNEIKQLKTQIQDQKTLIKNLTNESMRYQDKYKILKTKTLETQEQLSELYAEVNRISGANNIMEEQIQDLHSTIENAKRKILEKEELMMSLNQSEKALQLQIKLMSAELEHNDLLHKKNSIKLNKSNQKLKNQLAELASENEIITKHNLQCQNEIEISTKKERSLQEKLQELEKYKAAVTREREELTNQIKKMKQKQYSLHNALKDLEELNGGLTEENKKLIAQKLNLKREVWAMKENFTKQNDTNNNNNNSSISDLQTGNKEVVQDVNNDVENASKRQHEEQDILLVQENQKLKEEIEGRDRKMADMNKESREIQDGLLMLIDQLKEKCNSTVVEENTEVADNISEEEALKEDIKRLQMNLEETKKTADDQEAQCNKLKDLYQKLDDERIRVTKENMQHESDCLVYQQESENMRIENQSLHQQLEQSSVMFKEISDELQHVTQSHEQCQQQDASKEKESCEKMQQLEQRITVLQEKTNDMAQQVLSEQTQNKDIQKLLDDSEAKLKELQNESPPANNNKDHETENSKLKEELEKLKIMETNLREQTEACETERDELKKQIESTKKKDTAESSKLRSQLQKSNKEKDMLGRKYNESLSTQTALNSKVEQLTLRVVGVDKLRKELKDIECEKKKLEAQLDETSKSSSKGANEEAATEVNELREELKEQQKEKHQLKIDLEESRALQRALQLKIEEDEDCTSSDEQVDRLKEELDDCYKEKHQIKIDLEESQALQRALQLKIEEDEDCTSSDEQVDRLKEELDDCYKEKHQIKIELEESLAKQRLLQTKLDEAIDYDSSSEGECDGRVGDLTDKCNAVTKELVESQQKYGDLEGKLKETESEKDTIQQELERSKKSLDNSKKHREEDFKELQTLKMQLEEARKKIIKANTDMETKKNEVEELKKKDSKAEGKSATDLQRELQEARNNFSKNRSPEIDSLRTENESLKKDVMEMKDKIKKSNNKLDEKTEKVMELTSKMNKIVYSESELASECNELKQKAKEKEHEVKSHKLEIKDLKAKINSTESEEEKDDKIMHLKITIQDLREDVKDVSEELTETKDKLRDKSYELDTIKSRGTNDKNNSVLKEDGLQDELELTKQKLCKESDLLQTANDELSRKNATLSDLTRENEILLGQMNIMQEEKNEEVEELETIILNCQNQYQALEKQYKNEVRGGAGGKSNKLPSSNSEVNQIKRECRQLEEENSILKQKLDEVQQGKTSNTKQNGSGSKESATIDWNSAYRSYSPDVTSKNIPQPHADSSGDSLNLCVPSQMSRMQMHQQPDANQSDEDNPETVAPAEDKYSIDKLRWASDSDEDDQDIAAPAQDKYSIDNRWEFNSDREGDSETEAPVGDKYSIDNRWEFNSDREDDSEVEAPVDSEYKDNRVGKSEFKSMPGNPYCQNNLGWNSNAYSDSSDHVYTEVYDQVQPNRASPKTTNNSVGKNKKEKKKTNKKSKEVKALAPLAGPLPPVRANNTLDKPTIPQIGGNRIPAAHLINQGTASQKSMMFNNRNHNPLDSKPLPGLLSSQNSEREAVVNKKLGPLSTKQTTQYQQPRYHQQQQQQQHQQSPHFDDFYMKATADEYEFAEEDVGELVQDLDRTNAELDKIRHIQQQFY